LVQAPDRGDADNGTTEQASVLLSEPNEDTTMNTIDTFACRCPNCAGATCTCSCQTAPASQSGCGCGCGCGCGTGQPCRCGETDA